MNSTELSRFQRNLSFWSWRNKLREPPDEANINPIRIKKRKGSFIMVVYQPPVLELPVPIEAYLSVNGFVCIATSVVLVVSLKYLFSGNMINHKLLCSRLFIHRCRKLSSFPFSYEAGKFIGNRSARSDSSCSNIRRSFVRDGLYIIKFPQIEWEVGPCKWSRPRKQQRSLPIWSSEPKGNRWVNCIFFVLVDLSRTITAGVGLGLRTVRGASFCLIQLGPKTGGSLGELGRPSSCRSGRG